MAFGLLSSLLPLLLVFVIIRAVTGRGKGAVGGHPVRHFFQYMLLYGLMVVVAVGLTGLLQRALAHDATIYDRNSGLAQSLAFTIVGIPVLALLANWTRRRFAVEPAEADALGWGVYLTFAGLTALVVTMQALQDSLQWAIGDDTANSSAIATALVWGAAWGVHWWLDRRVTPQAQTRLHHVIGSIIGLVWAAVGLGLVLTATLRAVLPLGTGKSSQMVLTTGNPIASAATTLLVGALAWYLYWIRVYGNAQRDVVWDAYVMVVGVAGGLVTAVASMSVLLYTVLVWFFGSPGQTSAREHFSSTPGSAAAVLVGLLVWWYHRAVLADYVRGGRSEGQRIYEYLVAAIGLLAAASGVLIMFAALVETFSAGSLVVGNGGARNTLWSAVTQLVVGAPVWWIFWRRIERTVAANRVVEVGSQARRFYLFMLFGIGGTAAVISLLVAVYQLFDDAVSGNLGGGTLNSMRWALGVLVTTGAVAGYHWLVYRGERDVVPAQEDGPKYVLLAGVPDRELEGQVAQLCSGQVDAWLATGEVDATLWTAEAVLAVLAGVDAKEVVVVAQTDGLRAIPVARR